MIARVTICACTAVMKALRFLQIVQIHCSVHAGKHFRSKMLPVCAGDVDKLSRLMSIFYSLIRAPASSAGVHEVKNSVIAAFELLVAVKDRATLVPDFTLEGVLSFLDGTHTDCCSIKTLPK